MSAAQGIFYVAGAALELLGIALVASPDLVPGARRLSVWIGVRWRPIENRLRPLVGLPPRTVFGAVHLSASAQGAASVSAIVSVDPAATPERKLAFLLRRAEETQREMGALTDRVASLERESSQRLDELRERIEAHVSTELNSALAEYRPARVIGAISLALGLALTTAANFIG